MERNWLRDNGLTLALLTLFLISIGGHALLNLHANWTPAPGWQVFARIANVLDRRHESFGALAVDLFPDGRLLQPHAGPVEPAITRFVAPGAPRTLTAGLRYRF